MPEIGEIRSARELGLTQGRGYTRFIWTRCYDCGKERWVALRKGDVRSKFCRRCGTIRGWQSRPNRSRGAANPAWKGGRHLQGDYVVRVLQPDDFFYSMTDREGRVYEHRLIMAKYFNRCLLEWEVVHHKNGVKNDNRLENLELLPTNIRHLPSMKLQAELKKRDDRIANLEQRVIVLEADNIALRHQLKKENSPHLKYMGEVNQ